MNPVEALLHSYPGRFTAESATAWLGARRALLAQRVEPSPDQGLSVSSGCAATGAQTHRRELAEGAVQALLRLDAGVGFACEQCSTTLPFDRLDSAPAAVRCTGCAPTSTADARWCR